jgi:hypothetical protein
MSIPALLEGLGFIAVILLGWWLPGVLFYGLGLYLLTGARRRPGLAIGWTAVFLSMLAFTLYGGGYVKWRVDQRAKEFGKVVTYADVASDVRAIVLWGHFSDPTLIDKHCGTVCFRLLLSGRFDSFVIRVTEPRLVGTVMTSKTYFRTYSLVDRRECKLPAETAWEILHAAQLWAVIGKCLTEIDTPTISGRRFEILVNQDAPDHPPWPAQITLIRLVDGDSRRDIARAEHASVDLPFWFPVPGLFPGGYTYAQPSTWHPLLTFPYRYGPNGAPRDILAYVLGVSFNGPLPLPSFQDRSPDEQLALARQLLLKGPIDARYRFVKTELAAMRPLPPAYRDLVLDFIRVTGFKGEGYYQMMPYIAWLAAGDPELGPVIAKMYVDRVLDSPPSRDYARSLRYFGRDLLEPYAAQLLAAYERAPDKERDAFFVSLNLGVGGAGPSMVPKLIEELDAPPNDGRRAAAAAVSLCRIADPRAIEPLLRKVQTFNPGELTPYPISYAYALARLGRGQDALRALSPIRAPTALERQCLEAIVAKFPEGGAPESICLLQGPYQQSGAWQFSESSLACLAPSTPALAD